LGISIEEIAKEELPRSTSTIEPSISSSERPEEHMNLEKTFKNTSHPSRSKTQNLVANPPPPPSFQDVTETCTQLKNQVILFTTFQSIFKIHNLKELEKYSNECIQKSKSQFAAASKEFKTNKVIVHL
jgi:hypothetical protein